MGVPGGLPARGRAGGGGGRRGARPGTPGAAAARTGATCRCSPSTPRGRRDLDQAVAITRGGRRAPGPLRHRRRRGGRRRRAGRSTRRRASRGVTVYMPDRRSPLHPAAISEGAASLLPGRGPPGAALDDRPRTPTGSRSRRASMRAVVRSRRRDVLRRGAGRRSTPAAGDQTLALLREVGLVRLAREAERGGVSLSVPVQEVVTEEGGGFGLRYETPLPVEDWNAQVSLLAGICAARIMIDGGLGLFRTLAPAEPRDLDVAAPQRAGPRRPLARGRAVRRRRPRPRPRRPAPRRVRGARRPPLRRAPPTRPGGAADGAEPPVHAAIAAVYAHVTAPLRRLADRFAERDRPGPAARGREPPAWAVEPLDEVAATMAATGRRERQAERAAVDLVEAAVLAPARRRDVRGHGRPTSATTASTVQITDPAVVAPLEDGDATPGERISARLVTADPRDPPGAVRPGRPGLGRPPPGVQSTSPAGALVHGPRQDEQQVGEPVEVGDRLGGDGSASARATAERSARRQTVRARCRPAAAGRSRGQHEAREVGERLVDLVAPALEARRPGPG